MPKTSSKAKAKSVARRKRPADERPLFGPRGTELTGEWLMLAVKAGGVYALADEIGVSYTTLYRWAVKGEEITRKPTRMAIAMLASKLGVPSPVVP